MSCVLSLQQHSNDNQIDIHDPPRADEHVDYFVETPVPAANQGEKIFELPTEAPEMLLFFTGVMVALMSTNTPFGAHTRAFIKTAADRRAFVALVLDFLIKEVFEKVKSHKDIAKLSTPPIRLKDWKYPCGYAKFAVLPVFRPSGCRVIRESCLLSSFNGLLCADHYFLRARAEGTEGVYVGIGTTSGAEREKGHIRDAKVAILRLLYAALNLPGAFWESLVTIAIEDPQRCYDRGKVHYGASHPLLRLAPREFMVAFLSTFEALDIVHRRCCAGDKEYAQVLNVLLGPSPSTIALNTSTGLVNFLPCWQGIQRRWAARPSSSGPRGSVKPLGEADRRVALKAMWELMKAGGWHLRMQVGYSGKSTDHKSATITFPTILCGPSFRITIPAFCHDALGIQAMPAPSAWSAKLSVVERDAAAPPLAFMGTTDDARFVARSQLFITANGKTVPLACPRADFVAENITKFFDAFKEHAGLAPLDAVYRPRGQPLGVHRPSPVGWAWEKYMQAVTADRGALRRAAWLDKGKLVTFIFVAAGVERIVMLGELKATSEPVDACIWMQVDGVLHIAKKDRKDPSPVADDEWIRVDKAVERSEYWHVLRNDVRVVRDLEVVEREVSAAEAAIERGRQGNKCAAAAKLMTSFKRLVSRRGLLVKSKTATPFGIAIGVPANLARTIKEKPVFLQVRTKTGDVNWVDQDGNVFPAKSGKNTANGQPSPRDRILAECRRYEAEYGVPEESDDDDGAKKDEGSDEEEQAAEQSADEKEPGPSTKRRKR